MNLCIIPARGGSKRIPKKNIKLFCGKPLISYSIEIAKQSELFDKIIVSTDSLEIAEVAKQYGAEVQMRPAKLSDDYAGSVDVFEYVISQNPGFKYACMIYATAPFLQVKYLKAGFEVLKNNKVCYTFSATTYDFPIWRGFKINDNKAKMLYSEYMSVRSQDLPEIYHDAGQFYWKKVECKEKFQFNENIPILIPRYLVQDIDTMEDFIRAEMMYKAMQIDKFDEWNEIKKKIDKKDIILKFRPRDIFFMSVGQNVGGEVYGKDKLFLRPVLVYKKLLKTTFLGIPLTSKIKEGSYFFQFNYKQNKTSTALFHQMRVFDIRRADYFSGRIKFSDFQRLKDKLKEFITL